MDLGKGFRNSNICKAPKKNKYFLQLNINENGKLMLHFTELVATKMK